STLSLHDALPISFERHRLFSEHVVFCGHALFSPHFCRAISAAPPSGLFGSSFPISTQSESGRQSSPVWHWASESQTVGSHQPALSFVFQRDPGGHVSCCASAGAETRSSES